ncbi:gliding motility protein RemB [Mucilaginibacter sp.]
MRTKSSIYIPLFIVITLILKINGTAYGQSVYQPYSFDFNQKFSADLYSTHTRILSSVKTNFIDDSLLKHTYDSIMNVNSGRNRLLNEHLIDVKSNGNTFYGEVLPDFEIGRDFSGGRSVWTTSLGAQIGGTIGSKFTYYASFYANRAALPDYVVDNINTSAYIPGQGKDRSLDHYIKDWDYTTFDLSYTPIKYINFTLGKDKTFIGDGYRSLMLSDFASNYPFFKITATIGNVRYMSMYAYMDNPTNPSVPYGPTTGKWAYFQYIEWNINKRFTLGLFQNVMEADKDADGQKQGFNPSLASPFVFLDPLDNIDNNPAKNLLGLNAKLKVFNKAIIYGQFVLNEFHAADFYSSDGAVDNKSGYQIGFRGADMFNIKGLNYLAEFNTARPYTYSSFNQTSNYSQDGQPLADPFGANFREWVGILNYSVGRFDFKAEGDYALFGLDINGLDYGQNIFKPYTSAPNPLGNYIGQGLRTNFYYAEGKVDYIVNPKYNLRVELGGMYRNEKNAEGTQKTPLLLFGIKSSFRQIYSDF